jgi:hypothetical protein
MTKLYTTANGKTIRLTEKQFRTLAVAMYSATEKGRFSAVITLDNNLDDALICYRKQKNFACQRRVIMNENAVNYDLPTVLFSSTFFPTMQAFINLLWCIDSCIVEVYDSDGCVCKKVFNLRGV